MKAMVGATFPQPPSFSKQQCELRRCASNSTTVLVLQFGIVFFLLQLLQQALLLHRRLQVRARFNLKEAAWGPYVRPKVALVTLTDSKYLNCSLQLLTSARAVGWNDPMFLLSVALETFDIHIRDHLDELGVHVVQTSPIFDRWLHEDVDSNFIYRTLESSKFRKMEIFLNPVFRSYDRLIYMDPDGFIGSSLEPMLKVRFPPHTSLLMRQNEAAVGKRTLYKNEICLDALPRLEKRQLTARYPDRNMTGASCWFMVDVKRLRSPEELLLESIYLLCKYRAGFRLNDQTLLNFLFYNEMHLFPWCAWDEIPVLDLSTNLREYCKFHMQTQRWLNGGLTFIYRHMSPDEKAQCLGLALLRENKRVLPVGMRAHSENDEKAMFQPMSGRENGQKSCKSVMINWQRRKRLQRASKILSSR